MARNVALVAFGVLVGIVGGAALQIHAMDPTPTDADAAEPAPTEAEPTDQVAAPAPLPVYDWIDDCLDRLAWAESRNNPLARNPRSGASGLLQFLPSTFASTPQGRAGLSIWSSSAQRAAGRWMINQGRLHEWTTWRVCA